MVEVCGICDIEGCNHIRERAARKEPAMTDTRNPRDKIAAIIADATEDGLDPLDTAGAILAALPGMVPDLVWDIDQKDPVITAKGGYYRLLFDCRANEGTEWMVLISGKWVAASTKAECVEAANAHHRATIAKAAGWTP